MAWESRKGLGDLTMGCGGNSLRPGNIKYHIDKRILDILLLIQGKSGESDGEYFLED